VKSDENKWKTLLKYSVFGWGVPVIITIVYVVLVKKDVLRFHLDITGCVSRLNNSDWLAGMEKYGLLSCLLLYIIAMFSFTAYRIRQKLKESSSIAQKSNIVKKHNSFVLFLKLSTTTAISLLPLLFENINFDYDIEMALFTVAFLTGVYIGIAFVFTRKNYRLLRKKYFPAKKKSVK
jgi:amino acid transporter